MGDEQWIDLSGWDDGPRVPPPILPVSMDPGRRQVLAICCPTCKELDVQRYSSTGAVAYWRCNPCGARWKEGAGVGQQRAHLP